MVTIVERSGGTVSTKTACDIAATIVSGLFRPIASQIDPHRLSEVDRRMRIAKNYGERLGQANLKKSDEGTSLDRLIRGYPTHDFIIDSDEATEIFETVKMPSDEENLVWKLFPGEVMYPNGVGSSAIYDVVDKLESIVGPEKRAESQPNQSRKRKRASTSSTPRAGRGVSSRKKSGESGGSVDLPRPSGSDQARPDEENR